MLNLAIVPVKVSISWVEGLRWVVVFILCLFSAHPMVFAEETSLSVEIITEQNESGDAIHRIQELGKFHVRQLRPTRGETVNVKFELHFSLPQERAKMNLENRLSYWTHRLRDQVITAVRNAELRDFTEPGLTRLQQLIRLRIDRLLKFARIEQVYITQYEYTLE